MPEIVWPHQAFHGSNVTSSEETKSADVQKKGSGFGVKGLGFRV